MRKTILILAAIAALNACADTEPGTSGNAFDRLVPAAIGSAEPNLSGSRDGTIVLSWIEPADGMAILRYAVLQGAGWSDPVTVAAGTGWFVNWADFPSVVKLDETLWASHWLVRRPEGGTYAYDVAISLSRDDGKSWSDPITPHSDGTATEHGFVSLFPWRDGAGAIWLDGRNTVVDATESHMHVGGMTLRSAVITADGHVTDERLIDELVCDCCQTDVALSSDVPVAVYRDRTPDEVRDIYVTRFVDGEWQRGRAVARDHWNIAGCPVNGPAIAASGDEVVIAWFTAANDMPRVRVARSSDGARTFAASHDVAVDGVIGRVGVVLMDDGDAVVSWMQNAADGKGEIRIGQISRDGVGGQALTVASTSAGRMSGFPQLAARGDELVLAWTDVEGDVTTVKSAVVQSSLLESIGSSAIARQAPAAPDQKQGRNHD